MFLISQDYWKVAKTQYKGNGVFAKKLIKAGTIIGDYTGTIVSNAEYDIAQDKLGLYLMYYTDEASIYPDLTQPGIHLVNHSCVPNCWIYVYRGHTLFFALRDIVAGEELTISYLLSPRDNMCKPCTHYCNCGSEQCTHTMHFPRDKYNKWHAFLFAQNEKSKTAKEKTEAVAFGDRLTPLKHYPKIDFTNPIYKELANNLL